MTSLKNMTSEATKYGSLNEFSFFDKVRETFKSPEVYENFVRFIVIYNQELISQSELVLLVSPFLVKYADLFKWFKDFLGYKETNNNVEIVPKKPETQEQERVVGDFATEIEKESSQVLQTLSKDFGRIYESKVGTDILLRVGDDLIPAHRTMLSARSEVFAAMFHHDTLENQSGVVDIPDVDIDVLRDVLYYVYSGQTRGMSANNICSMYVVADKYALMDLRDLCLNFLLRSLTIENVCDAALLAYTHGETKLKEEIAQFLKVKLEEIQKTDKWIEMLKSKPSLAYKLLRSILTIYIEKDESSSSK